MEAAAVVLGPAALGGAGLFPGFHLRGTALPAPSWSATGWSRWPATPSC